MKIPCTTVEDAGVVIRALRKHSRIRIDDFALTAKVSKQYMTDLEGGKATVGMGRVLSLLKAMGVRVVLEVPDAYEPAISAERERRLRKTDAGTRSARPAKR